MGLATIAIVLGGDLVLLPGFALAVLKAPQLLFRADLQPEFVQHDAVERQLMLEVVDLLVRAPPILFTGKALDAFDQDSAVPAAIVDRDPSAAGELAEKAPQIVMRALFVGRRSDGDDAVLACIQSPNQPPNGTSFASSVRPFEQEDRAPLTFFQLSRELSECALELGHALFVRRLLELQRQVQAIQERDRIIDFGLGLGRFRLSARRQAISNALEDGSPSGHVSIAIVAGLDHRPGGVASARIEQDLLGNRDEVVITLVVPPIALGDEQPRTRRPLFGFESPPLLLLADVEPELDEQNSAIGERALEGIDARERLLEGTRFATFHHPLQDGRRVPRPEKQANLTGFRQCHPIPPILGSCAFGLGRRIIGFGGHIAGVEPFVEHVQRLGLVRAVRAVEQNDHRNLRLFDLDLRLEQRSAQLPERCVVVLLAERASQFGRFQHPPIESKPARFAQARSARRSAERATRATDVAQKQQYSRSFAGKSPPRPTRRGTLNPALVRRSAPRVGSNARYGVVPRCARASPRSGRWRTSP